MDLLITSYIFTNTFKLRKHKFQHEDKISHIQPVIRQTIALSIIYNPRVNSASTGQVGGLEVTQVNDIYVGLHGQLARQVYEK